jgi:hypothetical protein
LKSERKEAGGVANLEKSKGRAYLVKELRKRGVSRRRAVRILDQVFQWREFWGDLSYSLQHCVKEMQSFESGSGGFTWSYVQRRAASPIKG